jgi:hypothetical protein
MGSEQTLDVEYLLPRETGGSREGSAAVVRAHSTDAMPDAALRRTCRLADYAEWAGFSRDSR